MAKDVQRFETDCDLLRRPAAHIGSTARYDWDGMYIALMVRIHDQGLPATQAEWLRVPNFEPYAAFANALIAALKRLGKA